MTLTGLHDGRQAWGPKEFLNREHFCQKSNNILNAIHDDLTVLDVSVCFVNFNYRPSFNFSPLLAYLAITEFQAENLTRETYSSWLAARLEVAARVRSKNERDK